MCPVCCSLAWLQRLPPGTTAWRYFTARMSVRHRLRGWLRKLSLFLDPRSAAALHRPGASVQALQAAERQLQLLLPWELFELLRWADGQEADMGGRGVQAIHGARLLSLREVVAAVQEQRQQQQQQEHPSGGGRAGGLAASAAAELHRLGLATLADDPGSSAGHSQGVLGEGGDSSSSTSQAVSAPPSVSVGAAGAVCARAGAAGAGCAPSGGRAAAVLWAGHTAGSAQETAQAQCWGAQETAQPQSLGLQGPGHGLEPPSPPVRLLPLTEEVQGRKRYAMDPGGRVWLVSGLSTLPAADSLWGLLRRWLT